MKLPTKKASIDQSEWDFKNCPKSQLSACYWYEVMRSIAFANSQKKECWPTISDIVAIMQESENFAIHWLLFPRQSKWANLEPKKWKSKIKNALPWMKTPLGDREQAISFGINAADNIQRQFGGSAKATFFILDKNSCLKLAKIIPSREKQRRIRQECVVFIRNGHSPDKFYKDKLSSWLKANPTTFKKSKGGRMGDRILQDYLRALAAYRIKEALGVDGALDEISKYYPDNQIFNDNSGLLKAAKRFDNRLCNILQWM